VIVFVSDN